MKYLKIKDKKRRFFFNKIEFSILRFKFLFLQKNLSFFFSSKIIIKIFIFL